MRRNDFCLPPLGGEEMATRGKRTTAPLKRSVSGVVTVPQGPDEGDTQKNGMLFTDP